MGTIRIEGDPDGNGRGYTVTVDGRASGTSDTGGADGVRGSGQIYGDIGSGVDTFAYTGRVVDADLPSGAALYIDGQRVDPAALGGSSSSAPTPPTSTGGGGAPTPTTPSTGRSSTGSSSSGLGGGMVAVLVAAVAAVAAFVGGDVL